MLLLGTYGYFWGPTRGPKGVGGQINPSLVSFFNSSKKTWNSEGTMLSQCLAFIQNFAFFAYWIVCSLKRPDWSGSFKKKIVINFIP